MLGLSQTTGYAIHALACLEDPSCRPRLIRDIAACSAIPKAYLAKVINQLSRKGLVATKRGYHGGIYLAKPAASICLLDIVLAVEGERWIGDCLLGLQGCEAPRRCPTYKAWRNIRVQIEAALRNTTLNDVIKCLSDPTPQTPGGSPSVAPSTASPGLKRRPRDARQAAAAESLCPCKLPR